MKIHQKINLNIFHYLNLFSIYTLLWFPFLFEVLSFICFWVV